MKKSNLPSQLKAHRVRQGLTSKQLAGKFNVPEHEYIRVESGTGPISPEEEKVYGNLLAQEELGQPKARKWYHSKVRHLFIPIAICLVVFGLSFLSMNFREGWGENEGAKPPFAAMIIVSIVFCSWYWYTWTPELPGKKRGKN